LKPKCKSYERIKETEKEMRNEKGKRIKSKRLRGHDSAWDQKKPMAQQESFPETVSPSPSLPH
jgi:hypothetical protein